MPDAEGKPILGALLSFANTRNFSDPLTLIKQSASFIPGSLITVTVNRYSPECRQTNIPVEGLKPVSELYITV